MAAQLKPGQGPLDYGNRLWLKILFAAIYFGCYLPYSALGQLTARALIDGGLAPAEAIDRIRRQPELVEDSY